MATESHETGYPKEKVADSQDRSERIGKLLDAKRYERRYQKMQGFTEETD